MRWITAAKNLARMPLCGCQRAKNGSGWQGLPEPFCFCWEVRRLGSWEAPTSQLPNFPTSQLPNYDCAMSGALLLSLLLATVHPQIWPAGKQPARDPKIEKAIDE